jgi:hypothetical protein
MKAKATSYGLMNFSLYGEPANLPATLAQGALPPAAQGLQLVGLGSAGCETTRQLVAQELRESRNLSAAYIDNAQAGLKPLSVMLPSGETVEVGKRESLLIGAPGDRRDRAKDYPLLAKRVQTTLGRTPVFEDSHYSLSGNGGGALPPISALDIDLNIAALMTFLRERLRWLMNLEMAGDMPDLQKQVAKRAYLQDAASRTTTIAIVFGTAGSMGNASAQLMPYLIRTVLNEMRLTNYQLIGFGMGWQAFRGLTTNVEMNFHALMHALEHLFRHGQQRDYINGLSIDMSVPPFDQFFLLDDPTLPLDPKTGAVMESALQRFLWRSAQAIRALLGTNLWAEVMARAVNPDQANALKDDGKLRWVNAINIATLGADKSGVQRLAEQLQKRNLLEGVARRLAA